MKKEKDKIGLIIYASIIMGLFFTVLMGLMINETGSLVDIPTFLASWFLSSFLIYLFFTVNYALMEGR